MAEPRRRWLRRTARALAAAAAGVVIALALLVGTASQLLPIIERHPDRVADWLGGRTGQAVAFDGLTARWTRRGPLLTLSGLRIGDAARPLLVGEAQLLVSVYSGLVPGLPLTELRLSGLALELMRDREGRWQVVGIGSTDGERADPQRVFDAIEGLGEVQVRDARLRVSVPDLGMDWDLPRAELRARARGGRIRAGLLGWIDADESPILLVADLDRRRGDGELHLHAPDTDLLTWAGAAQRHAVALRSGRGSVEGRIAVEDRRVVSADLDLELRGLRFPGAAPRSVMDSSDARSDDRQSAASGGPSRSGALTAADAPELRDLHIERIHIGGRWWSEEASWSLQVPDLTIDIGGRRHDFGDLVGQGDAARFVIELERIALEPLAQVGALFEHLPPRLRNWLGTAAIVGDIEDLRLHAVDGRVVHGRASARGLGFDAVDGLPGAAGIAGALLFDHDGATFRFDGSPVRLHWDLALKEALQPTLRGALSFWHGPGSWHLGSSGLEVRGEDYGANARGELRFSADRPRPWLSLAVAAEDAPVSAAQRFWLRHEMPARVVEWLESALVAGRVESAQMIVGGGLEDWPFRNGEGVFEAQAQVAGLELAFAQGWPPLDGLAGRAQFSGTGMSVDATAAIAGVTVDTARARLADWRAPVLQVDATGAGSGRQLLELLRSSPVGNEYHEALSTLELGGGGDVRLDLTLPFGHDTSGAQVRGTVDLHDARIADARWDVEFTDAVGRLEFTEAGVSSEGLRMRLGDDAVRLGFAIGEHVSVPANIVEARMSGRLPASALLARTQALADWAPRMAGRADFDLDLEVPAEAAGSARPRLRVRSDLVGIDLDLPAPLRKRPRVAMPLDAAFLLPPQDGGIEVRLGGLLHFRGRLHADGTPSGVLALGGPAADPAPHDRFDVGGQVGVLDAGGWSALLAAAGTGTRAPDRRTRPALGPVDVRVGQLDLLDAAFLETRLQVYAFADAVELHLAGPEIQGIVTVPEDPDAAIVGRFERLHWPAGRSSSSTTMPTDPSRVPSLDFEVEDLRFGEARLGHARLKTFPTQEGMRVEQLATKSSHLELDAVGTWSRIDDRDYSRFALRFDSGNLGRMLDSLGYVGVFEGGVTAAELVAGWAGSPAAFSLDLVEGTLAVEVDDGRILDIEPGAGRLLGLVSITELPRRLSLDFSDFFGQGFGFNTIRGEFDLGDGAAVTDNLRIDGPAAEIRIRGHTSLRAQRYDQTVEVLPKAGGVLPVVGAITGGPAGAALGAVAQAVLQRPFREATRTVYRVVGPWREPEMTVVERGPPRAPVPAAGETGAIPGDNVRRGVPEPRGARASARARDSSSDRESSRPP